MTFTKNRSGKIQNLFPDLHSLGNYVLLLYMRTLNTADNPIKGQKPFASIHGKPGGECPLMRLNIALLTFR